MRNLRNIGHRVGKAVSNISAACWDTGKDEVVLACGLCAPDQKIELLRLSEDEKGSCHNPFLPLIRQCITSWDALSQNPHFSVEHIVSFQYFSESNLACFVFEDGDVVVLHQGEGSDDVHIEIMGSIYAGITAARWSPDEELLCLASKADTVVFMSRSFDCVAEAKMTSADLSVLRHVSVGWGKKETQFKGKGAKAKALRDPTIPEKIDEGKLSPNEDGRTTVSWRGDGAYVAINAVEAGNRRHIRIYTRDGVLDGVSEPVDGLEGGLSWRPAGNLIAGVQRYEDHVDLVFFEKNGLRHGQFTLRSTEDLLDLSLHIILEWNSDSTVLAVSFGNTVQLWMTGNYHWYLKQEVLLGSLCSHLSWHPEKPLHLAIITQDSVIHSEFVSTVARGSLKAPNDCGAVAVIDGRTIKVTNFRTANVPPPMSMFDIDAPGTVIDVAFSQDNSTMAVLHQKGVEMYAWPTRKEHSFPPRRVGQYSFLAEDLPQTPLQISFASESQPSILYFREGLKICRLRQDADSEELVVHDTVTPTEEVTLTQTNVLTGSCDDGKPFILLAQARTGTLLRMTDGELERFSTGFPIQMPWVDTAKVGEEFVAFGLSRSSHLYAGSRLLVKNCTSFLVTPQHLIFTTSNHFLKFVHLNWPVHGECFSTPSLKIRQTLTVPELNLPPDDPDHDERCRSVERGAKLVTAIPTTMSVVLQMPRGNLETIYPRAMVLAGVRQLIDAMDYNKAFACCRTQRVDMNILYDHNPVQFLAHVPLFLDQLGDVARIDLFLASLREGSVTETMYRDTKKAMANGVTGEVVDDTPKRSGSVPSKINAICDTILMTLQSRKDSNLQNMITANMCKNPPALDDGLLVVAGLMEENEAMAEKAAEHICFLQDVNRLFDHALGLYNLDLALLIAQQSQRDPREYLPFIQDLHQKPELRRRFVIDDHLGRREKALQHLYAMTAFDELQIYMTKHTLFQHALHLYRYDVERYKVLTSLYAEFLDSQSKHLEAGLAFESLGDFARATACYRAAGGACWRECLFTAQQQDPPISKDAFIDLATSLADALWEAKDYVSAATIHLEYLDALDAAVRCHCKAYQFADAMRLVVQHNCTDLLSSAVDVGLADALSSSTDFLADCKAQLRAQVPRIAELRRKALEDPLAFYEGEKPGSLADLPDDVSVAANSHISTSASLFTQYTGKVGSVGTLCSNVSRATSKNRKREEKKRARGRKGTVYETEYLLNSVRRLVERVDGTRSEVERLVSALMRRGMAERARAIEALMDETVEACRMAAREVFETPQGQAQEHQAGEDVTATVENGYTPTGAEATLYASLGAANARQMAPIITKFTKLSLFG